MKASPLVFVLALAFATTAPAGTWSVPSPDKHQTYAYGDDEHRTWFAQNGHLSIRLQYTNDPYVDATEPREWDAFIFNFPDVRLSSDGKTFLYTPAGHPPVPVARRHGGFLGVKTVELLPTAALQINKYHGLLTLDLYVTDGRPGGNNDDENY